LFIFSPTRIFNDTITTTTTEIFFFFSPDYVSEMGKKDIDIEREALLDYYYISFADSLTLVVHGGYPFVLRPPPLSFSIVSNIIFLCGSNNDL
jgi:hypothetical protein